MPKYRAYAQLFQKWSFRVHGSMLSLTKQRAYAQLRAAKKAHFEEEVNAGPRPVSKQAAIIYPYSVFLMRRWAFYEAKLRFFGPGRIPLICTVFCNSPDLKITLPEHPTCEHIFEVMIFVVWYITFRQALGKLRSAKSRINYSQPELGKLRSGHVE